MIQRCVDTFQNSEGLERQRRVCRDHPCWCCEGEICSSHSPGPVDDAETLVFFLINPTHFDAVTGLLNPIAFQEVHNRDLSVLRTAFMSLDEVTRTINELVERGMEKVPPQERKIDYFSEASAASIRKQVDADEKRIFGVYDTALPDKPAHASVFTTEDVLNSKSKRAIARRKLHAVFAPNVRPISSIVEKA